jgi:hypothetical protein
LDGCFQPLGAKRKRQEEQDDGERKSNFSHGMWLSLGLVLILISGLQLPRNQNLNKIVTG